GRDRLLAARQADDALDAAVVALEAAELLARLHVPQPQDPVGAGRQGLAAVGREGDGIDDAGVPLEAAGLLAAVPGPPPHGLGGASGQDALAVGRHRQGLDLAGVALVAAQLAAVDARRDVERPDAEFAVVAGGDGLAAVGVEGHAPDRAGVPLEALHFL